jgi:hypothetical protein
MLKHRIPGAAWTGALLLLTARAVSGQVAAGTVWDSVGRVLQSPPTAAAGYTRYNFPRRDIPLMLGDVSVAPGLALGSWAGFAGSADSAVAMGDLVLLGSEVAAVLGELDQAGLDVTAIHNHLAGELPALTYVHFHGEGTALSLAAALDRVLRRSATPRPVTAAAAVPLGIDTNVVFAALGLHGKAAGMVAQLSPVLVAGPVSVGGHVLVPALAYGSPINLQQVTVDRMVGAGDFAVLEARVMPLLHALTSHGITATAMHSHLVGETPRIYYIHFWADGKPDAVLAGLKAALNAATGVTSP